MKQSLKKLTLASASRFIRSRAAAVKKGASRPLVHGAGITTEEITNVNAGFSTIPNMKEKYDSLKKATDEITPQSPYPLIQRVPFSYMLRNHVNFKKYFEPRVMAIGPLHHPLHQYSKPHLQLAEQHKSRLAGLFINENRVDPDVLYSKIWAEIQDLRKCFDQEAIKSFTNEELGWILFVDGCAVLQLLKCVMNDKWEELKIKPNELTTIIWDDLFLLENQIPFRVLELLRSSNPNQIETQRHWRNVIQVLVKLYTEIESTEKTKKEEDIVNPVHLLDLLHAYLVPNTSPSSSTNENPKNSPPPKNKREEKDDGCHIVRNVKDLKSAGIYLQRSRTSLLTDISFTSRRFSGLLTLPIITVDDSTGPKLMNLIAYEMCPDYDNDFTITSYVCFMDSLIDQAEDVRELRKARILLNFLGSDEEVAQLFNEISTDLVPNLNAYKNVKKEIEKHCGNKWKIWLAKNYHDHFSSPWSIVASSSAGVALLFSGIQTWLAVFPS